MRCEYHAPSGYPLKGLIAGLLGAERKYTEVKVSYIQRCCTFRRLVLSILVLLVLVHRRELPVRKFITYTQPKVRADNVVFKRNVKIEIDGRVAVHDENISIF